MDRSEATTIAQGLVNDLADNWMLRRNKKIDRDVTRKAIERYYTSRDLPMPIVVWASSIPSLIYETIAPFAKSIKTVKDQIASLPQSVTVELEKSPNMEIPDHRYAIDKGVALNIGVHYASWDDLDIVWKVTGAYHQYFPNDYMNISKKNMTALGVTVNPIVRRNMERVAGTTQHYRRFSEQPENLRPPKDMLWERNALVSRATGWSVTSALYTFAKYANYYMDFSKEEREKLDILYNLYMSCWMVYMHSGIAYVVEYPEQMLFDNEGRLNSTSGPAISWADGAGLYFLAGIPVEKRLVTGRMTLGKIASVDNMEIRRACIEAFGQERYLRAIGATIKAEDEWGRLWVAPEGHMESRGDRDTFGPYTMIEMKNSTPEPDGTYKTYWMRADPRAATPKAAIAASYGYPLDKSGKYSPSIQT